MSEHDSHEPSSFIKTPKQLIAVIVLAFVVPIAIISMLASIASQSVDPAATTSSEEAVAKRLKPVGESVVVPGPEPAAAPAQVAATTVTPVSPAAPADKASAATPDAAKGKSIHDASCGACHNTGAAGAPKTGDKAAWAPRIKQGVDPLHQAALKGKGAMPPKGGNMALSDADVKAAVDFMVIQAK